jgi:hypothetical protein
MNNSTEMAGSPTQRRRMPSVEGYYDEIPVHGRAQGQTKSNDKVSPVKHDSTPWSNCSLVQVTYKVQDLHLSLISFALHIKPPHHPPSRHSL